MLEDKSVSKVLKWAQTTSKLKVLSEIANSLDGFSDEDAVRIGFAIISNPKANVFVKQRVLVTILTPFCDVNDFSEKALDVLIDTVIECGYEELFAEYIYYGSDIDYATFIKIAKVFNEREEEATGYARKPVFLDDIIYLDAQKKK